LKDLALYIHIPFCHHKCIYCDFYSLTDLNLIDKFVEALICEINYYAKKYSRDYKIISIFFGGGTPSILSVKHFELILAAICKNFVLKTGIEITIESNPGTIDLQKLKEFKKNGVNRISIGIQSFDDNELEFLTRIHDSKQAIDSVLNANKVGFKNINIDLIFGLPKQNLKSWKYNLEKAIQLPITHVSAYSLIIEENTKLFDLIKDGRVKKQDEKEEADFYKETILFLTQNNFHQYEVSNFAKNGFECVHNNAYWRYKDYIGFGPSAHSFLATKRWNNYSSLNKFINWKKIDEIIENEEKLSADKIQFEYIMLAIRSKGLNLVELKRKFGDDWLNKNQQKIDLYISKGFLVINNGILSLTSAGYAICDEILANIL